MREEVRGRKWGGVKKGGMRLKQRWRTRMEEEGDGVLAGRRSWSSGNRQGNEDEGDRDIMR